jgi:hypothetical protein
MFKYGTIERQGFVFTTFTADVGTVQVILEKRVPALFEV